MNAASLAMQLRVMRRRAGFNQQQLADRSGIGVKKISAIEVRHTLLSVLDLLALCEACGATPAEFFAIEPTTEELAFLRLQRKSEWDDAPFLTVHGEHRVDPIAALLPRDDSPYPSLQSSLGGVR